MERVWPLVPAIADAAIKRMIGIVALLFIDLQDLKKFLTALNSIGVSRVAR